MNYYAENDPLLLIDQRAASLSKKAQYASVASPSTGNDSKEGNSIGVNGSASSSKNASLSAPYKEVEIKFIYKKMMHYLIITTCHLQSTLTRFCGCQAYYKKHNTSFIFLKALSNNPISDHSMEVPIKSSSDQ